MSQLLQSPGKIALTFGLLIPLLASCTTSQAVDRTTYTTTTSTQASFSEAKLDSLLAPIALYPDTVLSHVLIASTYPLEVVEADRWARNNSRYKGDDAVNAVDNRNWDPSVKALVAFPDILRRMSEDLDWTQQLGDAFLADEERVMDSIQTLRNRAYASGNLDKVEHVRVIREEKTIVIEPSVERVVYVPAYDTRVVYGNWWWQDYPPVYWTYPGSYVFVNGFYWGHRVHIGPRFYFSGCHWNQRRVYVIDHHHRPNHRFYDSRSVVRHVNATRWSHNPVHRRGVAYYDNNTRQRFNSPRESYRESQVYRANVRGEDARLIDRSQRNSDERARNPHIAPNQARDLRQNRPDEFQQRLERRQAGQISTPTTNRTIITGSDQVRQRADQLRDRMNNREERTSGTVRNDGRNQESTRRWSTEDNRQPRENQNIRQPENRTPTERLNPPRIERTETPRTETPRTERQQIQRQEQIQERQQPRFERPERLHRTEQQQPRTERFRDNSPREMRGGGAEIRGGRER